MASSKSSVGEELKEKRGELIAMLRDRIDLLKKTRGRPTIGSSIDFEHHVIQILAGLFHLVAEFPKELE